MNQVNHSSRRNTSKNYSNTKLFWRPKEVRPVAAWVMSETQESHSNPMISAMAEEKRLYETQIRKEIKLKHFQDSVKQRLALAVKSNREEQLQKFLKTAQDNHLIISKGYYQNAENDNNAEEYRHEHYFAEINNNNNSCIKDLTRRAYMDSERERVREIKRLQQVKRRLNRQKEMEKVNKIFKINNLRISKTNSEFEPITDRDDHSVGVGCVMHDHHHIANKIHNISNEFQKISFGEKKSQEDVEQERLISHLKENLAMKFSNTCRSFPQLCYCCSSFLDIKPKTCAKNCPFSNNPSSLIRALKTFLSCL